MLLVLDSCDHVVEAAASLAENLLKGAQGLKHPGDHRCVCVAQLGLVQAR